MLYNIYCNQGLIIFLFLIIVGAMSADTAASRWKYLRDRYVRARKERNAYVPSGSCAQATKKMKLFSLYDLMTFVDENLEHAS